MGIIALAARTPIVALGRAGIIRLARSAAAASGGAVLWWLIATGFGAVGALIPGAGFVARRGRISNVPSIVALGALARLALSQV